MPPDGDSSPWPSSRADTPADRYVRAALEPGGGGAPATSRCHVTVSSRRAVSHPASRARVAGQPGQHRVPRARPPAGEWQASLEDPLGRRHPGRAHRARGGDFKDREVNLNQHLRRQVGRLSWWTGFGVGMGWVGPRQASSSGASGTADLGLSPGMGGLGLAGRACGAGTTDVRRPSRTDADRRSAWGCGAGATYGVHRADCGPGWRYSPPFLGNSGVAEENNHPTSGRGAAKTAFRALCGWVGWGRNAREDYKTCVEVALARRSAIWS